MRRFYISGRVPRVTEKPLIRLNVRCRDERQIFNTIRFGQAYVGKVANPEDMVKCFMVKERTKRDHNGVGDINSVSECYINVVECNIYIIFQEYVVAANRVEDIVSSFFAESDTLKLFSVSVINEAVKKFIDANANEAIKDAAM